MGDSVSDHERVRDLRGKTRTREEIAAFYDNWNTEYEKDLKTLGWHAPTYAVDGFAKLDTNKDAKILDCAAGTGLVGEKLKSLGYHNIDAVDISENMLRHAEERGVYNKLICAEIGTEPIPGVSKDEYDAIICSGGFVDDHITDICLTEWTRIVKQGGLICIVVNALYLHTIEGETLNSLLQCKKLEQVEKYQVKDYVWGEDGYFVAYKVL